MYKNTELINILKAELTLLSKDILQNIQQDDIKDLYKSTRSLYEKMAAVMLLRKQLEPDELTNVLIADTTNQEEQIEKTLRETFEKENVENDIPPEVIENILNETSEKEPEIPEETIDELLNEVVEEEIADKVSKTVQPEIMEEELYKEIDKISFVPKEENKPEKLEKFPEKKIQTSEKPLKKMSIGLNDRISFIKQLFKGDIVAYTNVIDKLNAFDSYEDALRFINQDVKPLYHNWEGLDEYEFRLLQLLELKFA